MITVLMPELLYRAKIHLFRLCQGQGIVLCSRTVQSAHTNQTNWASGVKRAWAWHGLPGVSTPTWKTLALIELSLFAPAVLAHETDTEADRSVWLVRWWSASFSSEVAQTKPPPATD